LQIADSPGKVKLLGTMKKNLHFGKNWVLNKKLDTRLVNDIVDQYSNVSLRPDWNSARMFVMVKGLIAKFSEPSLRKKLVELPDDTLLVEHTSRDKIWANGGDGKGLNYLGKMLTVIAHVLKYGNCDHMSSKLQETIHLKL